MQSNLTTANDNMPLGCNMPLGYNTPLRQSNENSHGLISVSDYSPVKSGVKLEFLQIPSPVASKASQGFKKIKRNKTGRFPVYVLLLLWVTALAVIAIFADSSNSILQGSNLAIAGGGLGLLSLWLALLARQRNAKICHSIGIAGACMCLAGLLWFYVQQSTAPISPEFLALGIAGISLAFARIWRTPFLLHLSLLSMIGWSSFSFLSAQISELAWLFPALWLLQMFLALEFRIKRSISLCILTGLLWIATNLFLLS